MTQNPAPTIVILAAGLGKRMRSELPKVVVSTREAPMLHHVLDAASPLSARTTVIITGHKREIVEQVALESGYPHPLTFAFQEKQEGTGHAVRCAEPFLRDHSGEVLILSGDVPLIQTATLTAFLEFHRSEKSSVSIISTLLQHPGNLGRVERNKATGTFERIVEAKDCTTEQLRINEINGGIYAVTPSFLWKALHSLNNNNAQKEYYLTDIVEIARTQNLKVSSFLISNSDEVLGVNSPSELAIVNTKLRVRQLNKLEEDGVQFEDTATTYIDPEVTIGAGTRVGPNVTLKGKTTIGQNVIMEGTTFLTNTTVSDSAILKFCVRAENASIGAHCSIGPFAHLRPGTQLDADVKVGNFVEAKNARIGQKTAVSHLTYLGDCDIGKNSNIGAGTITCNYDGTNKHQTSIGDNVFIGSNSCLVAPVMIESNATVGAGSVITRNVPKNSLALTRPEMKIRENYQRKK
jgi:bifunctional UDP-N-acetylglucosamine pyrophosphorylase/glucosamine-1-phosphate N-acetyltransferase